MADPAPTERYESLVSERYAPPAWWTPPPPKRIDPDNELTCARRRRAALAELSLAERSARESG